MGELWALRRRRHLQGYRRAWLPPDIIAGLTVWAVLVPHSLVWPSVAGLPAVVGLYAGVPALIFTRCSEAHVTSSSALPSVISEPVLEGFIVGLALTIIIGQVPKLKHHPLIPNRNVRSLPEATVAAVVIAAVIEFIAIGGR